MSKSPIISGYELDDHTMKTQGSHPVSNLKRKRHSKALRRSEKMHPARFSRPKSTFLTIPILIAGTNSVSSNTLVEPFFNCLFTFTMECGAYSNNAMSSRSSFKK
jgi:hypothetical protein